MNESTGENRLHTPQEIAARLGGISQKTLSALIRTHQLETTTLGYAAPSRNGGPRRRIWAMTDAQLDVLLALRNRRDRHVASHESPSPKIPLPGAPR